ncbi:glycoside hydrolase family 2 [Luteolibacter flavescens]|uniref:Glycoside hydrolase family 2 n=1 Tax=Luteolibacter flavescens TaxID=1859460 RepID=A0ABT3FS21_9BACT|nr:sugar-binding domain-containing protein [Luteolibacter flavescens]MCW1886381.1 glycoside hydrolase family 2 [Luteolibacter flavescens]
MKDTQPKPRRALAGCLGLLALAATTQAQEPPALPQWKYTTDKPADGWEAPGFDDAAWKSGPGGFGGKEGPKRAPGGIVNTEWTTDDIWLRRTFELKELPAKPALFIHHDDDAEVFLNGKQIAKFSGYTQAYKIVPLELSARDTLVAGANLLAVHCHQGSGGQYIDAHVIDTEVLPDLRTLLGSDGAVHSKLITPWGEKVTAENAWREYPRPQLKREQWTNLNGHWDYAITTLDAGTPAKWAGKILVPYPVESKLSGVRRMLQPYEALWYRRPLDLTPKEGKRTILHFEAVDYRAKVWVNDKEVGTHVGGNLPFHFDVTDVLKKEGGNTLTVRVEDSTGGSQLRGKQVLNPGGIFYTRNSGIWQTVWAEEVPQMHITGLNITSDIATGEIKVDGKLHGADYADVSRKIEVLEDGKVIAEGTGGQPVKIPNAKLWSPESPHLYDIRVSILGQGDEVTDQVTSYTGLRQVGKVKDKDGRWRFTLNGKTIFHWGPLDQGWWPDGLLTPPSDDAMVFEIQWLKDAGFNMIRKHIKVEPQRYYYHCDKIGMLVWQDQVSGGASPPWTKFDLDPKDAEWSDEDHKQWLSELDDMITLLGHFPSIVVWTPFNEAWGQHRTMQVGDWSVKRDATRHINIASGGNFWPVGDIADLHHYPDPGFPTEDKRYDDFIKVVGEFGGHGWPVKDHLWNVSKENWGYGGLPKSIEEYRERYVKSIQILTDLKAKGIAGGVYTQTADVEEEINGLMSYDRKVIKIPAEELKKIHAPLTAE